MKFLKRVRWVYLLLSLFLIGLGVCWIMWPEVSLNVLCMIVGGGAVVFGLAKVIFYFVRRIESMVEQYDFSTGLLCIAGGTVLLIQPPELLRLVPQVLALYMLCDCVFKLQVVLDAKRLGSGVWFLELFMVMVCVAWGVCLLVQPFGLDAYVTQMMAGGLIADGVLNLLSVIFIAATVRKEIEDFGPGPDLPDPIQKVKPAVAPQPEPEPDPVPDVVESGLQVRDIIESSRQQTNQPEGKGGIFGFFKK